MAIGTLTKQADSYGDLWGLVGLAALAVLLAGLTIWLLILPGPAGFGKQTSADEPMAEISQTAFTDQTGIRLLRLSLTAGGGMLDLRYQAVDPDKAVIVHDRENPPALLKEATGQVINRPYHEHNDKDMRAGITYSALIINLKGTLKPGDLVTVIIGETRLEHVPVQ